MNIFFLLVELDLLRISLQEMWFTWVFVKLEECLDDFKEHKNNF